MVTDKCWTNTPQLVWLIVEEMVDLEQAESRWESTPMIKGIDHELLESDRCFLIFVSQTLPSMVLFLKGIHSTLNS
jgi:hypothetical protein